MQLTQKHFEFIAKTLAAISSEAVWSDIVHAFANELAQTNPKFKRDVFLKQCGLEIEADFVVRNEGSIYILTPNNDNAKEWIDQHTPEDAQFFGKALVVEHHYIADIVSAIQNDGMSVEGA